MTAAASHAAYSSARQAPVVHALDDFLAMSADALKDIYRSAETPRISELDGDLRGRMLASPLGPPNGALAHVMRALGSWNRFPWRGKSFSPHSESTGEGINRILIDQFRLYRFETSIGPSRAGDFDAFQLDYDLPSNPFFIRVIKDEIRRVEPGVFLGTAWAVLKGTPHLALYFGLTTRK